MARPSIPRGRIKRNVSMRRTSVKGRVTSMGGLPALRMAWDTLDMDSILLQNGFEKHSGIQATDLAFSAVAELFIQAGSNVQLEKASFDPAFENLADIDHLDESTFSRFFNDNRFWWPGVLVGAVQNLQSFDLTRAHVDGVLILDDTISAKTGKKIEGVRKLYDSSAGKYVMGHFIVNLIYSGRGVFYPLACKVAVPQDEDMEYATKNELGLAMLKSAVRTGFTQTVVHDSAYLCNEIMEFSDSKKIPWVFRCKTNRILFYKGQRIHADELGLILSKSKFRRHKLYRDIEYASAVVELPGHGPCRFVAAKNFREDEPDGAGVGMKYLIASNPCWHGSTAMRVYKARWKVEEYHRTTKQNLGLGNYHGRKLRGVIVHLVTVALAHILVVFMRACLPALKNAITGEFIRDWICISCRISLQGGGMTVLIDRELPFSDAVYHYQLARAG